MRLSRSCKGLVVVVLACTGWLMSAPLARAQSLFCPASAFDNNETGFAVENGACTNGQTGSFSGAALASQALSSLSQTATQETTRTTATSITTRRDEEEQRCAEGFIREDGACRRTPAPVVETLPGAPPAAEPPARTAPSRAKVAAHPREAAAKGPPARMAVQAERYPAEPAPLPIEPPARFGAWAQVYGDYEKRNATGAASVVCCVINQDFSALPLTVNVQSRTGTVGFQAGLDLTSRGLILANDGLIVGALVGYLSSTLNLNSVALSSDFSKARNEVAQLRANLTGPTLGLYATYFDNGFSTDFLFKVDILHLNETFQDSLAFCACIEQAGFSSIVPFSGNGSVNLVNATVAGNLNYRFPISPSFWIEPTVGSQYTLTSYGSDAVLLGLADGSLVRVQGGARVGMPVWLNARTLMTTTLTGLAYSDVLVSGGFIPGAGFAAGNILAQADQGQVRGRGVVAVNLDYGNGISSFIQGEARGGQGLLGAGGKAGVRIVW